MISFSRKGKDNYYIPLTNNRELELEIIVDNKVIEVFINDGRKYLLGNNTKGDLDNFSVSVFNSATSLNKNPKTIVKNLEIHELKSIWQQ
jgi:sucrose-6-phosphate hydrolase SacC (GH32 family)